MRIEAVVLDEVLGEGEGDVGEESLQIVKSVIESSIKERVLTEGAIVNPLTRWFFAMAKRDGSCMSDSTVIELLLSP